MQAHISFLITAPHFSHYSPWLHGGKCAASQMWHLSSFSLPSFLFASVLILILTCFILFFPTFFFQTPTLPASSVLAPSLLPLQSCKRFFHIWSEPTVPPKGWENMREMLRHSWIWRTTQTSPRICFNTWSILAFHTMDLHVWLQIFDWFGLFLTVISEPLEQQVLSCICDQWWRDWSHAPITGDMLLPHFAELKLCQETPTLVNYSASDMDIHLLPVTCVNTKGREWWCAE